MRAQAIQALLKAVHGLHRMADQHIANGLGDEEDAGKHIMGHMGGPSGLLAEKAKEAEDQEEAMESPQEEADEEKSGTDDDFDSYRKSEMKGGQYKGRMAPRKALMIMEIRKMAGKGKK